MSNTHTAPMCPSYVGTIPYGIGYLFYKLQSDGTCVASYSILSNGEAPKTINGNLVFSDGVTIPSTAESYALALPLNSTEIAQAPTITNTITTIKTSSSQVQSPSTTTIPTSNNKYPITTLSIPTTKISNPVSVSTTSAPTTKISNSVSASPTSAPTTKISNPVSTAINVIKSKTTAIPNALFNFYSMYRNYLLGLIILAIFVVIIAKGDKKHE